MKKIFYGWWIVLGCAVMMGIAIPASVAVANIYQGPITEEFGITNSQFAIVNTIVLAMGIFFAPLVSQLLGKAGNFKKVMTVGILMYGLAYAAYGLATNIWMFYILSVFVGFGLVVINIMHANIIINNWFIEKRGTAISLALTGFGFGGIIFSQMVSNLINSVGWRQTYFIYGAIILVFCLSINFFVYKERPEDVGLTALGARETDKSSTDYSEEIIEYGVKTPIEQTYTKAFFIALIVGSVLIGVAINAGLGQFPPFLSGLHGVNAGALVVSLYSGAGIIGKLAMGVINDKFGVTKTIIFGFTLSVCAYLLMTLAGNYSIAVIAAVFFGMGNAIGSVVPPLVTASIYAPSNYSKAYGYSQSGLNLGMTLGSLIAAAIADSFSYEFAWVIISVVVALGGLLWIYSVKSSKKFA